MDGRSRSSRRGSPCPCSQIIPTSLTSPSLGQIPHNLEESLAQRIAELLSKVAAHRPDADIATSELETARASGKPESALPSGAGARATTARSMMATKSEKYERLRDFLKESFHPQE